MCSLSYNIQKGKGMADIGPLVRNRRVFQRGGAVISPPYYYFYYSPYNTRGRGIGSVFFKFFKAVSPMLVKGLKSVGREVLSAGSDILANSGNEPIKKLVKSRSKQAFNTLKRKAEQKIEKLMDGSGDMMKMRGIKRKRKINLNQSLLAIKPAKKPVKRTPNKKKKVVKKGQTKRQTKRKAKDIFGN